MREAISCSPARLRATIEHGSGSNTLRRQRLLLHSHTIHYLDDPIEKCWRLKLPAQHVDFFCAVRHQAQWTFQQAIKRLLRIRRGRSIHRPGARTTNGYRLAAVQINPDSATGRASFTLQGEKGNEKWLRDFDFTERTHTFTPFRYAATQDLVAHPRDTACAACFPLQPNPAPCRRFAFCVPLRLLHRSRRRIAFVLSLSSTVVLWSHVLFTTSFSSAPHIVTLDIDTRPTHLGETSSSPSGDLISARSKSVQARQANLVLRSIRSP